MGVQPEDPRFAMIRILTAAAMGDKPLLLAMTSELSEHQKNVVIDLLAKYVIHVMKHSGVDPLSKISSAGIWLSQVEAEQGE